MSAAGRSSQPVLSVPQTPCATSSSSSSSSSSSPPQSPLPSSPPATPTELLNQICDRLRRNDFSAEWSRDYEHVLNRLIHCAPKKGKLIPCRGKRGPPQYIQLVTHSRKQKSDRSHSHNKRLQTEINIGKRLHKDPIHDTHNDSDKLTPNLSLGVVNDLGLNGKQARRYRHIMKTTGTTSVIASDYAIKKVLDERNWQFESDTFQTIVKTQVKNAKKGEKKCIEQKVDVPYTRMVNVSEFLTQQFDELLRQGILFKDRNGRYRLLLPGDKGGHSTKLGLSFLRQENAQCAKYMYVLAAYEGKGVGEDYDCVKKVMQPAMIAVDEWARLNHVDVFIGGDMKWLWLIHGMSCNGSYDCLYCLSSSDRRVSSEPQGISAPPRTYK